MILWKRFFLVEESTEGGYIAKELSVSIFIQTATLEALRKLIKDAGHCHFDDTKKINFIG